MSASRSPRRGSPRGSPPPRRDDRSRSPRRRRSRSRERRPPPNRRRGRSESPKPTNILGVFGLSQMTDERELRKVFEKFGNIEEINLIIDKQSGNSRGFAFIYFEDVETCTRAKEECNGMEIDRKAVRTDYSVTKKPHASTPGRYLGRSANRYRDNRRGRSRSRSPDRRDARDRSPRRENRGYDRRDRRSPRRDDRGRDRDRDRSRTSGRDERRDRGYGRDRDNGRRRSRSR